MLCVTHSPETKNLSKAENKRIKNQEIQMKIKQGFQPNSIKKENLIAWKDVIHNGHIIVMNICLRTKHYKA